MADINDFKVLKNKSIKMYEYFSKNEFTEDDAKARMGFYHLVLENIAGMNEIEEIQDAIIDTEYNKHIFGVDVDDFSDLCFGCRFFDCFCLECFHL